jgi:acyl carrier protein
MPPEIPVRIRRVVGTQLGLPIERLLPDDEFMVVFGDLDFYELILEVEEEFGTKLDKHQLNNPQTLRGLSELVLASRFATKV